MDKCGVIVSKFLLRNFQHTDLTGICISLLQLQKHCLKLINGKYRTLQWGTIYCRLTINYLFFFESKIFSRIERQTSPLWVNLI